jgi:hypothetical protein
MGAEGMVVEPAPCAVEPFLASPAKEGQTIWGNAVRA